MTFPYLYYRNSTDSIGSQFPPPSPGSEHGSPASLRCRQCAPRSPLPTPASRTKSHTQSGTHSLRHRRLLFAIWRQSWLDWWLCSEGFSSICKQTRIHNQDASAKNTQIWLIISYANITGISLRKMHTSLSLGKCSAFCIRWMRSSESVARLTENILPRLLFAFLSASTRNYKSMHILLNNKHNRHSREQDTECSCICIPDWAASLKPTRHTIPLAFWP